MSIAARWMGLTDRIVPGAAAFLARAFDRVLDWIADALTWLPARFAPAQLPLVKTTAIETARGRVRVALDPASVFVTRLALRRRDPFEARAAFALQASRHSPLPADELETGLALGDDGAWYAAMVSKAHLDALRSRAAPDTVDHFVCTHEGVRPFAIRGAAERTVRRTREGVLVAGMVLLLFSALLAASAIRDRTARALVAQQAARSELVLAVRQTSDELDALALAPVSGPSLAVLIESLDATGKARPNGWTLLSWRIEGRAIVAQFELAPAAASLAAELSQSLAGSGVVDTISTNTIPSRTGLARLELRAQIVEELP